MPDGAGGDEVKRDPVAGHPQVRERGRVAPDAHVDARETRRVRSEAQGPGDDPRSGVGAEIPFAGE